jgi:DNA polymerase III subunit delta'
VGLENVAGQEAAKTLVRAWVRDGRLPQTILLSGPSGSGKRRFALETVKLLNCRQGGGCGSCIACRKIENLTHPDLYTLLPLGGGKDTVAVRETQRAAALDYLADGKSLAHSGANIARDHLRVLQREMLYGPAEAPWKAALIFEAECMHPAGANSLLKILEDPPPHAVFFLVSSAPERLLPTVVSRCQQLKLRPLSLGQMRQALGEDGIEAGRLEWAARLGEGSLQRAREVATGLYDERCQQVEAFIAAGAQGQDEGYWQLLDELGGRDKGAPVEHFLRLCAQYLRDLFVLGCGHEAGVVQTERLDFLLPLRSVWSEARLERAALEVDRAYGRLAHNVGAQLLLADLWRVLRHGK